jgi:GrpB-like predicted nucleotidyltransferase (UPF0157 family)
MSRIMEVVDYGPARFTTLEKEAAILNTWFGQRVVEMHHIGASAVPGKLK